VRSQTIWKAIIADLTKLKNLPSIIKKIKKNLNKLQEPKSFFRKKTYKTIIGVYGTMP